uniref:Uncharacterized protein n=1 Tax=Daphnia magna TaxID=35525 RepID=A0A0N8APM5_9CRUS
MFAIKAGFVGIRTMRSMHASNRVTTLRFGPQRCRPFWNCWSDHPGLLRSCFFTTLLLAATFWTSNTPTCLPVVNPIRQHVSPWSEALLRIDTMLKAFLLPYWSLLVTLLEHACSACRWASGGVTPEP